MTKRTFRAGAARASILSLAMLLTGLAALVAAQTDALHVDPPGNVGIGTSTPATRLHVLDDSGNLTAKFENNSGQNAQIQIAKTGGTTSQWNLAASSGHFSLFRGDGVTQFYMSNFGNVYINGTLTQSSDVNAKRDLESIRPEEVLAKVLALPISTWAYKAGDPSIRHMGPMAQDFYAAFGLGKDDKGISTMDTSGAAFGAIQGLHKLLSEKDRQIRALEERLRKLEQLIQ